jgi:hypothetical protein
VGGPRRSTGQGTGRGGVVLSTWQSVKATE